MQNYNNEEIEALGIQIGCIIRLERLRKRISQEDLGLMIGSNKTTVGRVERYENSASWKILYKICQSLKIEYKSLFILQTLEYVLLMIKESYSLEDKLTNEKKLFYKNLENDVKEKFSKIKRH